MIFPRLALLAGLLLFFAQGPGGFLGFGEAPGIGLGLSASDTGGEATGSGAVAATTSKGAASSSSSMVRIDDSRQHRSSRSITALFSELKTENNNFFK